MLSTVGKQTKGFFSKLFGDEPPPEFFSSSNFSNAPWLAFVAIKVEEICYADLFESLNVELLSHPTQTLEQALKVKKNFFHPFLKFSIFVYGFRKFALNVVWRFPCNVYPCFNG